MPTRTSSRLTVTARWWLVAPPSNVAKSIRLPTRQMAGSRSLMNKPCKMNVNVEQSCNGINLLRVRKPSPLRWPSKTLPEMPCCILQELEAYSPTVPDSENENERKVLRPCLSEPGKDQTPSVHQVRLGKIPNAPRGLLKTNRRNLVVPVMPFETSSRTFHGMFHRTRGTSNGNALLLK